MSDHLNPGNADLQAHCDVVVIGSGVGGSTAAALLAARGLSVQVLEKNSAPGGIMASYVRDGFKIDVGSHLIARGERGPIGRLLKHLGLTGPKFLTHRIPSTSRGIFECRLPGSKAGLPLFALQTARDLGIPARDLVNLGLLMEKIMFMGDQELALWDRRSLDELIRTYTEHAPTYYMLSFLMSIFFVLPPWEASAGETIYTLRRFLNDYRLSYVRGGMSSITDALLDFCIHRGGTVQTRAEVEGIHVRDKGFTVQLRDGREVDAGRVICNMHPEDAMGLVRDPEETGELLAWQERIRSLKPSMNAYQAKFALKRPLVQEGCFIGGVSVEGVTIRDLTLERLRRGTETITRGELVDPLAVYAPVPTNFDPTLAPNGRQLITASIYGPITPTPFHGPELWKERILKMMASIVPHLEDELLFYEFTDIPGVGAWMGKSNNAAISNAQCPGQVGADRLPVTTPIPGLFICGDSAGGRGIGTELAAVSGMEAADAAVRGGAE